MINKSFLCPRRGYKSFFCFCLGDTYISYLFEKRGTMSVRKTVYLPELIIRKILLGLPVKSLGRSKTVAKNWERIISRDDFVKEHCALKGHNCIVAKKQDHISYLLSHDKETIICPHELFELVGSARGLVCLHHKHKFSLWNPDMRKSTEFSLASSNLNLDFLLINNVGFCFDLAKSDYKVVVCFKGLHNSTNGIVYSFVEKEWSNVVVPDSLFAKDSPQETPTVIVNDCPYWAHDMHDTQFVVFTVTKFDGRKFMTLPQFRANRIVDGEANYQFTNMNDKITVLAYEKKDLACPAVNVYCLDNEVESAVWNPIYKVGPSDFQGRCVWPLSQYFRFGGELVIQGGHFSYDRESKKLNFHQCDSSDYVVNCYPHTPSLVLLPGMSSVDSQTKKFSFPNCSRPPWQLIESLKKQ